MAVGSGPVGGRRRYMAEINVTPLVDVMLVLLIIFMVTAPMMTRGLDVKLPETTARPLPQKENPVTITIKAGGDIFLNKVPVDPDVLRRRLAEMKQVGGARQVLLRADRSVAYGTVAGVMTSVREAGIDNMGFVTEPLQTSQTLKKNKRK